MSTSDVFTQWAKLFPTGTYLSFKTLASTVSNNGTCGITEQVLTGTTIFIFSLICSILTFTDSYVAENGQLYYGIASRKGLWSPALYNSGLAGVSGSTYTGGGTTHVIKKRDFVNALLSVLTFATLSLLSSQATHCFYGNAPSNVIKAAPILVGGIAAFIFALLPPARNGVGCAVFYLQISGVSTYPD